MYPHIFVHEARGSVDFITRVREIIRTFDYQNPSHCDRDVREFYKLVRKVGRQAADRIIREAFDGGPGAELLLDRYNVHLGQFIISELTEQERERFIPFNDVLVHFDGDRIRIIFSSLLKHKSYYYSSERPQVDFYGQRKIVAFARHAVERICKRIEPNWKTYKGLANAHAYLAHTLYYEPTFIRPQKGEQFTQPAICLFESCFIDQFDPRIITPPHLIWA
jgi:hypothetical protein